MTMTRKLAVLGLAALILTIVTFVFASPIPQDRVYLGFADAREMFGLPNFWNVISNLPFLIFGVLGALEVFKTTTAFARSFEKIPFMTFFVTLFLTGLGSGLFHFSVNMGTLFWDRLPISLSFMALMAALLGDRTTAKIGVRALIPFLLIGAASVFVWDWSERAGHGDLRFYALVQFGSMPLLVAMLFLFKNRYTGDKYIWMAMGWYVVAKVCEVFDRAIYEGLFETWSGHTWKHLTASFAAAAIWMMIRRRRLQPS